ncbi:SDR family NAD(P)-dependent oxidoreductase [Colwellia sp. M166]|uniref:SDR family NAD(P)-dependent oxidoreductase n=1 Tax=Colwellia sp. M166 TaxID=2583805 RepID=UPI00211F0C5B|nr:SDR family NAD(P)-dependent oxidoreductase [Colwellia sp. M166]UUO23219.1 SDR family NAD(P)-dependent oxidoreductase [Colwellia sp. M166]|tara:strand:- start:7455 stop:8258 length:804 start_codon:yes stop_codon:yes gene_type:complete
MKKMILITGATDGIGLETAKLLASNGHDLLIHGRNIEKLNSVKKLLTAIANAGRINGYLADLSVFSDVAKLVSNIKNEHKNLDVLINNAGVFKINNTMTSDGLDVRFVVNTISPYILTQELLPLLGNSGRIINLSSAAQAPVNIQALLGKTKLSDIEAYAQSKLAITMWSKVLADKIDDKGPTIIAVNPGSLLASKMVKEGFGVAGHDLSIGAKILTRMALEGGISEHSGQYFDNDSGQFSQPHPDGLNLKKSAEVVGVIETIINRS